MKRVQYIPFIYYVAYVDSRQIGSTLDLCIASDPRVFCLVVLFYSIQVFVFPSFTCPKFRQVFFLHCKDTVTSLSAMSHELRAVDSCNIIDWQSNNLSSSRLYKHVKLSVTVSSILHASTGWKFSCDLWSFLTGLKVTARLVPGHVVVSHQQQMLQQRQEERLGFRVLHSVQQDLEDFCHISDDRVKEQQPQKHKTFHDWKYIWPAFSLLETKTKPV